MEKNKGGRPNVHITERKVNMTFSLSPEVAKWLNGLESKQKSKTVDAILKRHMSNKPLSDITVE